MFAAGAVVLSVKHQPHNIRRDALDNHRNLPAARNIDRFIDDRGRRSGRHDLQMAGSGIHRQVAGIGSVPQAAADHGVVN